MLIPMTKRLRFWFRLYFMLVAIAVTMVAGVIGWLLVAFPKVGPAAPLTIATTPALVDRGRYLFDHVAACAACHSQRDSTKAFAPVKPTTEGMGGQRFAADEGIPGVLYASNITPFALKSWTDGEIRRALVSGVSRDGRPLFPLMPFEHYAKLGEDDIAALIAYLRVMPDIANEVPASSLDFPMNLIARTIPREARPPARGPVVGDPGYPAYVVNAAACLHCHSPTRHGTPLAGREFSGGVPFPMPGGGTVYSANLTPDQATGLGSWTKDAFIARFRSARAAAVAPLGSGTSATVMPWASYAGMTDQDLGAVYDYLHALPAVENRVPVPIPAP